MSFTLYFFSEGVMGKLDAFKIPGLYLYFLSSDHRPPHFHVHRRGEWEIRVYFLECTRRKLHYDIKWLKVPESSINGYVSEILSMTLAHRVALLGEWNEKVAEK